MRLEEACILLYNNELYNVISTCGMPAVRFSNTKYNMFLSKHQRILAKLFTVLVLFTEKLYGNIQSQNNRRNMVS